MGEAKSFSMSDSSWMASAGTLASSSTLFSQIWVNTFKVLETFAEEIDDRLELVEIVWFLLWLYCLCERLNDYIIDLSSRLRSIIMRVIYNCVDNLVLMLPHYNSPKILPWYWPTCGYIPHKLFSLEVTIYAWVLFIMINYSMILI